MLDISYNRDGKDIALIILNSSNYSVTSSNSYLFRHIWDISTIRICADGGANLLYDILSKENRYLFIPDCITVITTVFYLAL